VDHASAVPSGRSSRHSNVAGASEAVKANDAPRSFSVCELITVSGARVSTVNVRVAGVASVWPSASVARTEKTYSPSARSA